MTIEVELATNIILDDENDRLVLENKLRNGYNSITHLEPELYEKVGTITSISDIDYLEHKIVEK